MADDQNKPVRRVGSAQSSEDIPVPPRPGFTSPFQTIAEWLTAVCNSSPPPQPIAEFSFLLFGATDDYLLCVAGYNTYWEENCEIHQIDFEPNPMFFKLPKHYYAERSMWQVRTKVLAELVAFTETAGFRQSFLSQATCLSTSFSEDIWPTNYNDL